MDTEKRRPEGIESSSEDEEEENMMSLEDFQKQRKPTKKNRSSVSAEVYGLWNKKKQYTPKNIEKSDDVLAALKDKLLTSFMFKNLDDGDLKIVLNAMEPRKVTKGEKVIKQGDDGDVLYFVLTGSLACSKVFPGSQEETFLLNYEPGMAFGELALLYNTPRAASIVASEDCELYTLDRECFNSIVKESAIKKRERYMDFLGKVNLLDSLDSYEKSKLCDCLQSKKFKSGENILTEGEKGDTFYFIEEGKAFAKKKNGKGGEDVVFHYKENDYFGELALLKDQPRAATVVADGDVKVAAIDRLSFKRLLGPLEVILQRNSEKYAQKMKELGIQL